MPTNTKPEIKGENNTCKRQNYVRAAFNLFSASAPWTKKFFEVTFLVIKGISDKKMFMKYKNVKN